VYTIAVHSPELLCDTALYTVIVHNFPHLSKRAQTSYVTIDFWWEVPGRSSQLHRARTRGFNIMLCITRCYPLNIYNVQYLSMFLTKHWIKTALWYPSERLLFSVENIKYTFSWHVHSWKIYQIAHARRNSNWTIVGGCSIQLS